MWYHALTWTKSVEGLLRRLYKLFDEPNWGGGREKYEESYTDQTNVNEKKWIMISKFIGCNVMSYFCLVLAVYFFFLCFKLEKLHAQ